jgi:hypothetical protein
MRSTLRAATAIAITLGFVLPAVDAAAISPNASTGIYSAEQPNLLLVGKKNKGNKGNRQRGHKGRDRHHGGSRTVVVNNDYGHDHDDGNAGAALVTGLIVGAAVGAAVNESASE